MRYNHFDMLPERAFQRDVSGKIKPQGGGGSSAPSKSTVTQTNIPEYARPYAESMLGRAQALTDTNQNPFEAYTDQRFAGFSPMQAQAFQNISQQQVSPQIADASNIAYTAAGQALGAQPTAQMLQGTALGYGQAGAGYGGAASQLGLAGAQQAQTSAQQAQRQAGLYGLAGYQAGQAGMGYGAQGAGFGQQAANYGALGAQQAAAVSGGALGRAQQLGGMATGIGGYGQMLAQQTAQQAGAGAMGYGAQGAGYGAQGVTLAEQAQRAAEGQADIYGQMGAGFGAQGAQGAQLASQQAQQAAGQYAQMGAGYGAQGVDLARQAQLQAQQQAMGYGQMGAGYGAAAAGLAPQAQQFGGTAAQMGQQGMGYGQQGVGIGGRGVSAAEQGFGAQQAYQQMATSPEAQQAYMSPYMQNVVKQQQEDARRQSLITRQAEQAQAVKQGAFGGSRSAIVEAESRKNLEDRLADIQATGSQQAFQQAQQAQQFGAGLGIQGLQAGYQGLQTGLAGTAQGMQGAQTGIAGQQAGLAGLQQAGQLYGLGMTGAGMGLQGVGQQLAAGQLGLAGTAQGMQGAGLGLQGVGQQIAAGQLGLQGAQAGMQGAGLGLQGTGQRLAAGQLGLQGTAQGMQGAGLGLQGIGQLLASGQLGVQGSQLGLQGVTAGMQGVGQELAAGQLGLQGTAQGIQGAQAGIQGSQAGMQGAQTAIQGAQAGLQGVGQQIAGGQLGLQGAQTGIQGQQAGIQGAQAGMQGVGQAINAGQYGLQGAQTAIQGAGQLGQLGQTQYAQQMGITDAMQKYGALQQQQKQQELDFAYQQYLAQQQYPYQQLSYMSDLLRGVPSTQSAQYTYMQQPAVAPQILGAGLSAYGAFGRASGGRIPEPKRYADGGQVTPDAMGAMDIHMLPKKLQRLSDTQLAAYARNVQDAVTLSAVQSELNRRTRHRAPMAQPQDTTVADDIAKRAEAASIVRPAGMAGGGIVALQGGGTPYFEPMNVPGINPKTPEERMQEGFAEDEARFMNSPETRAAVLAAQEIAGEPQDQAATEDRRNYSAVAAEMGMPQAGSYVSPYASAAKAQSAPPATESAGAPVSSAGAAPVSRTGIAQARPSAGIMSYEDWQKQAASKGLSDEDNAVLKDMRDRITKKMERAGKAEDTAKYDAIMMAGLAMMGGTSLADGIAKAAQVGGATYMQGRDKAAKALEAAEETELAFNKYKLELAKGNKKEAREAFGDYMKYLTDFKKMDTTLEAARIQASARAGVGQPEIKNLDKAMIRIKSDPGIELMMQQLKSGMLSAEQTKQYIDAINKQSQQIMQSFGVGDKFTPLTLPSSPEETKKPGFWSSLFGGESKQAPAATMPKGFKLLGTE